MTLSAGAVPSCWMLFDGEWDKDNGMVSSAVLSSTLLSPVQPLSEDLSGLYIEGPCNYK